MAAGVEQAIVASARCARGPAARIDAPLQGAADLRRLGAPPPATRPEAHQAWRAVERPGDRTRRLGRRSAPWSRCFAIPRRRRVNRGLRRTSRAATASLDLAAALPPREAALRGSSRGEEEAARPRPSCTMPAGASRFADRSETRRPTSTRRAPSSKPRPRSACGVRDRPRCSPIGRGRRPVHGFGPRRRRVIARRSSSIDGAQPAVAGAAGRLGPARERRTAVLSAPRRPPASKAACGRARGASARAVVPRAELTPFSQARASSSPPRRDVHRQRERCLLQCPIAPRPPRRGQKDDGDGVVHRRTRAHRLARRARARLVARLGARRRAAVGAAARRRQPGRRATPRATRARRGGWFAVAVCKFGEQCAARDEASGAGRGGPPCRRRRRIAAARSAAAHLGRFRRRRPGVQPLQPRAARRSTPRRRRVPAARRRRIRGFPCQDCAGRRATSARSSEPLEQVCVREVELCPVGVAVWVAVRITDHPEDAHQVTAVRERPIDVERQQRRHEARPSILTQQPRSGWPLSSSHTKANAPNPGQNDRHSASDTSSLSAAPPRAARTPQTSAAASSSTVPSMRSRCANPETAPARFFEPHRRRAPSRPWRRSAPHAAAGAPGASAERGSVVARPSGVGASAAARPAAEFVQAPSSPTSTRRAAAPRASVPAPSSRWRASARRRRDQLGRFLALHLLGARRAPRTAACIDAAARVACAFSARAARRAPPPAPA